LTKDSARVTADALDALGRTEEAKALQTRAGARGDAFDSPSITLASHRHISRLK
jgi:hypothetical protein